MPRRNTFANHPANTIRTIRKYIMHLAIRLANHQGVTKLLRSSDKEKDIKKRNKETNMQYVQRDKDNNDSGFYL